MHDPTSPTRSVRALTSDRSADDLRAHDNVAYRALVLVVLAAYYRSDEVQAALGYPGPVATPVGRFEFPEYLDEGLLDHILERSP